MKVNAVMSSYGVIYAYVTVRLDDVVKRKSIRVIALQARFSLRTI